MTYEEIRVLCRKADSGSGTMQFQAAKALYDYVCSTSSGYFGDDKIECREVAYWVSRASINGCSEAIPWFNSICDKREKYYADLYDDKERGICEGNELAKILIEEDNLVRICYPDCRYDNYLKRLEALNKMNNFIYVMCVIAVIAFVLMILIFIFS